VIVGGIERRKIFRLFRRALISLPELAGYYQENGGALLLAQAGDYGHVAGEPAKRHRGLPGAGEDAYLVCIEPGFLDGSQDCAGWGTMHKKVKNSRAQ
jgi:hypothetical protein